MRRVKRGGAARAASPAGNRRSGLRLSRATWARLWRVIGWSATVAAIVWGLREMEQSFRQRDPTVQCGIEWVDLPTWMTAAGGDQALADIAAAADLRPDDDIHDPELCRRIATGLQASAWVGEVHRVTKRPDGVVRIAARYREPFAYVEHRGAVYRVDREGVRLPLPAVYRIDYIQDRFWNDWFRIVGVSGSVPDEGAPWPGEDLAAGLRLVQFLREATARGEVPFRSSLRAIDVANFGLRQNPDDGQLRIRTIHPRSYIRWGEPPGEEYEVESPARRKLDMLRSVYARRGFLPEGILDVRDVERAQIITPPGS